MRPWTVTDDYNLRASADQGIVTLCYALRRRPGEIRARARKLRIPIIEPGYTTESLPDRVPGDYYDLIELYGSSQAEYCPRCGSGVVVPWHPAGRLGICPVCYMRAKTQAEYDRMTEELSQREYNKAKKQLQRIRETHGNNPRKAADVIGPSPYGPTKPRDGPISRGADATMENDERADHE